MKQKMPHFIRYALLSIGLGVFVAMLAMPAQAALDVKITESADQAIPIAIVPFGSASPVPLDIAKLASHDLQTTGLFDVVARSQMLGQPHSPENVNYANWRAMGTTNVVVGNVVPSQNGGYTIRFHILNTYSGRSIGSYEVNVARNGLRDAAHAVANLIYKQLTGEKGYFLSRIAYITVTQGNGGRTYQLVVADYDGHDAATIYSSKDPIMSPAWSPDGNHIAYVAFDVSHGRTSLRVQEVATGRIREISSRPGINGAPSWSPDGSRLALTLSYQGSPDIYVYNLRTNQMQRLTRSPAIDTEAVWAPDGNSIVFTSDRGGSPQLYRMSARGGQVSRITHTGNGAQDAAFSPDGKLLAFVENGPNGYRIAVQDLQTGNVRALTRGGLVESPDFAPNGQAIIYATQGGNNALATVSVNGEVHSQLSQRGKVQEPSWGPAPY